MNAEQRKFWGYLSEPFEKSCRSCKWCAWPHVEGGVTCHHPDGHTSLVLLNENCKTMGQPAKLWEWDGFLEYPESKWMKE